MARTTLETLCTIGFVIQMKNGKKSCSDSHVITSKMDAGPAGADLGFPGPAGPLCIHTVLAKPSLRCRLPAMKRTTPVYFVLSKRLLRSLG